MDARKRNRFLLVALAVYLAAVALSVIVFELKHDSLQFHTRDYPYFIEQAAKLADPRLTNRFATNIDGFNFLGLQGPEGVKSIYHAIHTEYFRYTYTVVYLLFQNPTAVYIFYCLVFYLPLLYFAFLLTQTAGSRVSLWWWFAALFLLFPGLIDTVSSDLRGRMQFIPAWILLMLAIYYRRPFWEKLVCFGLLLMIREEGILLGVFALLIDLARNRSWKTSLLFLGLDGAALAAFLGFMNWGGYDHVEAMFDPLAFIPRFFSSPTNWILLIVGLLGVILAARWVWLRRRERFNDFVQLLLYLGAVGLTGATVYRGMLNWYEAASLEGPLSAWDVLVKVLTDPSNSLVFYMILFLLALLWDVTRRGRPRLALQGILLVLCGFFAFLSLQIIPQRVSSLWQQVAPARLIWNYKAGMDRYQDQVLVDFNTYQAFYDCEHITVYNRLPLWKVDPQDRYFPANKVFLSNIVRSQIQYVVIGRSSYADILGILSLAGRSGDVLSSNEDYLVLKLR